MTFSDAVETYLAHRRGEGVALINQAGCLRSLTRHIGSLDLEELRAEHVALYLRARGLGEATTQKRYTIVSLFIRFHQSRGRAALCKLPPRPKHVPQVFTPHIFSVNEVRDLMSAAFLKRTGSIPPETFRVLLLFLYTTGSSVHSAVRLSSTGLDLQAGTAKLENQRSNGTRTVPLNPQLLQTLREYVGWKAENGLRGEKFFVRADGSALVIATLGSHFRTVLLKAGCMRRDGSTCRPRLYDFRATFAVQRISQWIKSGSDLGRMLPALAAYMGMIDLTTTEQFLRLSPERFRKEVEKLSATAG